MTELAEPVEAERRIRGILTDLVAERRRLRAAGDTSALEANRLAIVYWQQALARMPIGRGR